MRTTYIITMNDGALLDIEENSAGCAIQSALIRKPGHFVKSCRSGLLEKECKELAVSGIKAMPGHIWHDVPEHVALTGEQAVEAIRRRPKIIDTTVAMFDEAELKKDSEIAKTNFDRKSVFA